VQHEVVVPAGDGKRVELDRPETAEDFQDRVGPTLQRASRSKELACDEETPGGVGGDFHGKSRLSEGRRERPVAAPFADFTQCTNAKYCVSM
jgi:hypothetical protein